MLLSNLAGWVRSRVAQILAFAVFGLAVLVPAARATLVHQWTFNDGSANDSVGSAHGTLFNGATISGGKLVLDGVDDYMRTATIGTALSAKTLVAWVSLANTTQGAGSALTVMNSAGADVFDGIVYGEAVASRWMAGSDNFQRTQDGASQGANAAESSTGEVMIAIVYGDGATNSVKIYRNGVLYASYTSANARATFTSAADVLLGLRHEDAAGNTGTAAGNDAYLAGAINEARIYDTALTAGEVSTLNTTGPVAPALQSLTIYGTDVGSGTIDPNTDCSRDNQATWLPAYGINQNHPWGNIAGTTRWISRNLDGGSAPGVNESNKETLDFRIRFYAPADISNATLTYSINADNAGDIFLNNTKLNAAQIIGNDHVVTTATVTNANIVGGLNTIIVRLTDWGGLLGINYKVDVQGYGSTAFQRLIAPPSAVSVNSTLANGSYKAGTVIPIQVTFSRTVAVTGVPTLLLETGSVDRTAAYVSGSGTSVLTFNYTVQPGDAATDLDYKSTVALALAGGTIKATAADLQDANLTLPTPGAAGSLGANKALVIDTIPPTFQITSTAPSVVTSSFPITFSFSEPVTFTPAISVMNGTLINFGGSGATYTGTIVPIATGIVSVTVPGSNAQDAAGNTSIFQGIQFSRIYDVTPPDTTITSTPAALSKSASATFAFSGTDVGAGVASFQTKLDGGSFTGTSNPSITFSGLGDGSHTFQVSAVDAAGNVDATPASFTWTVDTTAPTISINPIAGDDRVNAAEAPAGLVVSGSTDAGAGRIVTVTLNGQTQNVTAGASTWSATFSAAALAAMADGSYGVTAAVSDAAGNAATPAARSVLIDRTGPVITTPSSPLNAVASSASGTAVSFTATATDNIDGSVAVTLNPASGSTFLPGTTLVTATATDAAGNTSTKTFNVIVHFLSLTEDKAVVTIPEGGTATNSGTFSEASGAAVTLTASLGTITQTGAGQWTFQQVQTEGSHPIELALDTQENLYVANENGTVYKYDAAGALVKTWTVTGTPKGIAVDAPRNWVYVTSNAEGKIYKFDLNGNALGSFGSVGSGDGQFTSIHCVAVDGSGNVYATDPGNPRVQVFDTNGNFVRKWGSSGSGDGQFNFIQGIRVSSAGRVYVADRGNNRIQYFNTNGAFLGKWGSGGSGNGQFNQPASVGIDPSGNVYVGDISNNRVQKFTFSGTYVDQVGPGSGDGALSIPHGTAFPPAGRSVYIASWGDGRVVKYLTPGTWSWTYAAPFGAVGTTPVTVTANDGTATATQTFNLVITDGTAPRVQSIARRSPTTSPTSADVLDFLVTFTEPVFNVSPTADFTVTGVTGATLTGGPFPGSNFTAYEVAISGGNLANLNGTVTLTVAANAVINDNAGNLLTNPAPIGTNDNFFVVINNLAPTDVALAPATINQSVAQAGATIGTLTTTDPDAGDTFTYTLVTGTGSADNSDFVISGSTLKITPSFGLSPDTFHIRVRTTDAGGLSFEKALTVTVVDNIAPNTTIASGPATLTKNTSATFAFTATEAGSTFEAKLDSGTFAPATTPLTLSGLADGAHTFQVRATDVAGNTDATPASFTWTVDATAPVLTLPGSPVIAEATSTAGAAVTFNVSALDARDGPVGVSASKASGSTFGLGDTTVNVSATDAAGNVALGSFVVRVVDTLAPDTTIGSKPASSSASTSASFTFSGTDSGSGVASFEASLDGSAFAAVTSPKAYSGLSDGSHTFQVRAKDAAGNVDASPASYTWSIDATGPVITVPASPLIAEATSPLGATVNFTVTATDAIDGAVAATVAPASGTVFPIGDTTVTVTAKDALNNAATRTFVVSVRDTTRPVFALADLTREATSPAGAVVTFDAIARDAGGFELLKGNFEAPTIGANTFSYAAFNSTATAGGWRFSGYGGFVHGSGSGFGPPAAVEGQQHVLVQSYHGVISSIESDSTIPVVAGATYVVTFNQATRAGYAGLTYAMTLNDANGSTELFRRTAQGGEDWTRYTVAFTAATSGDFRLGFKTLTVGSEDVTFFLDDVRVVGTAKPVITTPPSGSTFALGPTPVNASATDAAGNTGTGSFTVTVVDTIKPVLTVPADIAVEATSAAGATVTFVATATDVTGTPTIAYSQNPGTTFPLGPTTVNVTATDGSGNAQTGSFTVTINPTIATITLTTPPYTYDGAAKVATATTTPTGLPVTFAYEGGGAPVNAGTHGVTAQVSLPWISGSATGTVVIAQATPQVALTPYHVTYDATAHVATGTVTGAGGELLGGLDLSGTAHTNAGEFTDAWTFTDRTGNYVNASGRVSNSIAAAPLTVIAAAATKVYGSADPALGFAITRGALAGADGFSGSLTRAAGENVGAYAIAQGSLTAGANYDLSFVGAELAITPATLTIAANAQTKVYGAADPTLTFVAGGFKFTDTTASVLSGGLKRAAGENVAGAPYAIAQGTLASNANYTIAFTGSALAITPAPLAIVANAQTKVYGAADPALTYAVNGLQFTDTAAGVLTGALSRAAGETVRGGPYAIEQGTLVANTNYTLGYTGAALTITPATATIAVQGYTGVYDGQPHGATGTATGVGGVDLSALLQLGAKFTNVPGGTANWTFSDPAGNYSDASGSATIVLTKADATIAVTAYAITYDGNPHTATGSAKGVSGETLAGLDLAGTTHTAAGSYGDTWTFTDATGNYRDASGSVTDSIGKAPATIAVTAYSVTYDTQSHTATGTAKGVKGETLAGLNLTGTTHTNAGTYTDTWTFTDVTGNYSNASATVTDKIAKAPAPIALAPLFQMYDGTPRPVTATTVPAGLTVDISYAGNTAAPTLPGIYAITAVIVDANYTGTTTASLNVGITALVRHGFALSGDIDGSIQVLTGEDITLNGSGGITGDLLVPGLPTTRLNGKPAFGGVHDSTGAATPTNYTVTLNGNALLRYLVRRVDPLAMPVVAAPATPTGTRSVNVNKASDPIGPWATVKDLTLNGNVGNVAVPAGVYGNLTANGGSGFTLGVAGATTPSVYELQNLTLNGNTALNVVGPVVIIVKNGINVNGTTGNDGHPEWLDLRVANGGVTLNGNVTFKGYVTAPSGTVTVNGNSTLTGGVVADKLVINGNATVELP